MCRKNSVKHYFYIAPYRQRDFSTGVLTAGMAQWYLNMQGFLPGNKVVILAYARQEAVSPRRVLVCLMRCANRSAPLSVKSTAPIPKELLFRCAGEVYRTRPAAPVEMHQTMIRDICGTGVDIVATNTLP